MTSVAGAPGTGSKNKRKVVGVVLFSGEQLLIHVDVKGKLYEVFNQVAAHLSLRETEYFGLAVVKNEEYQFLILDEKISKVAPKKWKTGPGEGYDSDGRPLLTVWFRVQFYVDQVVLLREKVTRHLYYLQLKENVLNYNHLYNEEKCFSIVAFALQADYGNFIPDKHTAGYFDPRLYFPAWMLEKRGVDYLSANCPLVHQDMHNITRTDAELKYVRECSTAPGAHNLHFYRVRKKKTDKECNTWLAICPRGVEVYEDDAGFKNLISTFLWPDIGRLVFDKKKFEIRSVGSAGGRRFAYYTDSDGTSKYLLHICRSTHMFQMAIQPKLMEIRHLDAEDKKRYRESYIYSDARDLHTNGGLVQYRCSKSPGKSPGGTQRFSVISDASSNTTSGIVSDKMAISFDEGEEGCKEIIIDCPPRQSSLHGMPTQSHTKVPLRGSYKMTPPTPGSHSPALPPQSLELFRAAGGSSGGKGSPATTTTPLLQDLSLANSNNTTSSSSSSGGGGSYRAKFQQTCHALYSSLGGGMSYALPPTPSPSSPPPAQPFSLLATPSPPSSSPRDKEVAGMVGWGGMVVAPWKESVGGGGGGMAAMLGNVSGDSTTTSGSAASTGGVAALSVENSPVVAQPSPHHRPPPPQYPAGSPPPPSSSSSTSYSPASFATQTLPLSSAVVVEGGVGGGVMYPVDPSPPSSLPPLMARLGLSNPSPSSSSGHHHHHHHHHLPPPPQVGEHLYTDRGKVEGRVEDVQEILAPPPAFADPAVVMVMSEGALPSVVSDSGVGSGGGHSLPPPAPRPSQSPHCGSGGTVSSGSSYNTQGGSIDSGHVLSEESSSTQHSAQSSEEDSGMKDAHSDSSASCCRGGSAAGKRGNTSAKVKAGRGSKATHVSVKNQKEALHPDIEQLLGQSQAQSLPLMTALCNDLMTGSSHSSTGSYDTATLRSTDSHPDSRRWSTCGGVESGGIGGEAGGSSGTMVVMGVGAAPPRPYSWHSEYFDLDNVSLSTLPPHCGRKVALPPHPAPHHRPPHHHHPLQVPESHRSFPHDLSTASGGGHSVLWTQAVTNSGSSAPYGGSLDRYSPDLIAQQLMIPSRLSSGGRSVADSGSIGHHKTLKENIGIA
ncbi:uncharacterized protein LOC143281214 [Babylonia areolata]|uniref:uncharacterized protein LOC143281214 n=1 Tax=Babylonia areolata TaxID=304850 RepID=UPI003FD14A6C